MKRFDPLRYLRKFGVFAFIVFVAISVIVCVYIHGRQSDVASVILSYSDVSAEGYSDGWFDENEITSSYVISNALSEVNTTYTVDDIRAAMSVKEYIASGGETSADEELPKRYTVTLTLHDDACARLLDAIVDNYVAYYAENHLSVAKLPNRVDSLDGSGYDYIEYAEALEKFIKTNYEYFEAQDAEWPDFRSSLTGYSFYDFKEEYGLLLNEQIPRLYSTILTSHISKDVTQLLKKYYQRISDNDVQLQVQSQYIDYIDNLIDVFSDKVSDMADIKFDTSDEDYSLLYEYGILDALYDIDGNASEKSTITYDRLICAKLGAQTKISNLKVDNIFCKHIIDTYTETSVKSGAETEIAEVVNAIINKLTTLEQLLLTSQKEHAGYVGMQNLRVLTSVSVSKTFDTVKYMTVAVVCVFVSVLVFGILFGCVAEAVAISRRTDKRTGLANNKREDEISDQFADAPLSVPFTMMLIEIPNLGRLSKNTSALRLISKSIKKHLGRNEAFYQGDTHFYCYLFDTTAGKADVICDAITAEMEGLTASIGSVLCRIACVQNSWSKMYTIDEIKSEVNFKLHGRTKL